MSAGVYFCVKACRIALPGSALFLISDFSGALEERALEHINRLARHLEITALHCADPLERQLPESGNYAVTDGESRARLYTGDRDLREAFTARFEGRLADLKQALGKLGIPLIEASTTDSPLGLLQDYYAGAGEVRR